MVTIISERQNELASLCTRFGVQQLEIFGSAATENGFDPAKSDLDFIVEFRADQELGPWMQHYFAFRDALSDLGPIPKYVNGWRFRA
jgi:predicted nucleotidyltransferase